VGCRASECRSSVLAGAYLGEIVIEAGEGDLLPES